MVKISNKLGSKCGHH